LRALVLALVTYVVIFALKLGAYFVTGVVALLAEALHALSDIFVSAGNGLRASRLRVNA